MEHGQFRTEPGLVSGLRTGHPLPDFLLCSPQSHPRRAPGSSPLSSFCGGLLALLTLQPVAHPSERSLRLPRASSYQFSVPWSPRVNLAVSPSDPPGDCSFLVPHCAHPQGGSCEIKALHPNVAAAHAWFNVPGSIQEFQPAPVSFLLPLSLLTTSGNIRRGRVQLPFPHFSLRLSNLTRNIGSSENPGVCFEMIPDTAVLLMARTQGTVENVVFWLLGNGIKATLRRKGNDINVTLGLGGTI